MRTRRLLGAAALTTLVAAGLSGCVKMDMQLDLQSDDTVDGSMVFAISSALAEMTGQDPDTLIDELQGDDLVDQGSITRTEPYDDGEYIGSRIYFEGEALDNFSGAGGTDELSIVREGDEFVVSGRMDLSDDSLGTGGGDDMFAGLMEGFDIQISITFPGKVSEHNGELSGTTVTWRPALGETNEMSARGSAIDGGGSGLPLPLLIGIGAAVLVALGLILFFVLRSRRSATAPAAAPAGYAPEGYPPAGAAPQATSYAPPAPAAPDAGYAPPAPPAPGYAAPAAPPPAPAEPPAPPTPPTEGTPPAEGTPPQAPPPPTA
jgi:hypothetical protein